MKRSVCVLILGMGLATTGCSSGSTKAASPQTTGGGSRSPTMQCSTGTCDESEVEAYGACIGKACNAEYQSCFGPSFATGVYDGGPCATYYTCLGKCSCNDTACAQGCGIAPVDCQQCIANTITDCVANSGCTSPVCGDASAQVTAYKTCQELAACCAAITDPTEKMLCDSEYQQAAADGDAICNAFVVGFEKLNYCP
jgi:hypothetical protein